MATPLLLLLGTLARRRSASWAMKERPNDGMVAAGDNVQRSAGDDAIFRQHGNPVADGMDRVEVVGD
jgi:hypothetical protein